MERLQDLMSSARLHLAEKMCVESQSTESFRKEIIKQLSQFRKIMSLSEQGAGTGKVAFTGKLDPTTNKPSSKLRDDLALALMFCSFYEMSARLGHIQIMAVSAWLAGEVGG